MSIEQAKRFFKIGSLRLPDPDPELSAEDAVNMYASAYPQVIGASLSDPVFDNDGSLVYAVERAPAKTKG